MNRLVLNILLVFVGLIGLKAQDTLWLYPENAIPDQKFYIHEDSLANERYYRIAKPRITFYATSKDENNGAAVLIIPGGGYHHITHEAAGIQMAKWFNTIGVNAFVLYYRLPNQENLDDRTIAPLQDAQRAMQLIRANAAKYDIDTARIGIMGTSAGGHLSALLATSSANVTTLNDEVSKVSFIPNFMILVSSVISMDKTISHAGSCDNLLGENPSQEIIDAYSCQNRVTPNTPPAFVVQAQDDNAVPVINSLLFYESLLKNRVPASLHIFTYGKHKIALRNNPGSTQYWVDLCEAWMKEMKIIK